jgi:hypothetical protein
MSVPAPVNYARNVAAFLRYRTGHEVTMPPDAALISATNKVGYFTLAAGPILALLIDENAGILTTKANITSMLSKITPSLKGVSELLVVAIIRSSHTRIGALTSLKGALDTLAEGNKLSIARLEVTGTFAFNMLKRGTFPQRESLIKNVPGDIAAPHLRSDVLTPEERAKYELVLSGTERSRWNNIAQIEENNAFCVWNGYRAGDIIWVETLSMNAKGPIELRRVIPGTLPKDEPEEKKTTVVAEE